MMINIVSLYFKSKSTHVCKRWVPVKSCWTITIIC
jgi:hypothetical protein